MLAISLLLLLKHQKCIWKGDVKLFRIDLLSDAKHIGGLSLGVMNNELHHKHADKPRMLFFGVGNQIHVPEN
jgi:hypothetical protein